MQRASKALSLTADLKQSTDLKPVIQEIVRTEVCPTPVTLLVDRVHIVPYIHDGEETQAYRIWLSDGEKSIQGSLDPTVRDSSALTKVAVLRREIHPYLSSREIKDGTIVSVTNYRLAQGKKLNGTGIVWLGTPS